jgi:hypothetical protein
MNPEQILAALAQMYAGCVSYRDHGQVVTRFIHLDDRPGHTTVKTFSTAFVRPHCFRFEYRDEYGRYLICASGELVRAWWDVTPGVEQEESLGMALAGATGVSGGSAYTVPALLLPTQVGGASLADLVRLTCLTSLGDEVLDGVTCYRLQGRSPQRVVDPAEEEREREEHLRVTGWPLERSSEDPLTLWIDRGTFLLRRIEEHTRFETFRTEQITTYEPVVGIPISEEELRFDPPA